MSYELLFTGRSSGSRIVLLAGLPVPIYRGSGVCGFRTRLQRRDRSRFLRDSLLGLSAPVTLTIKNI